MGIGIAALLSRHASTLHRCILLAVLALVFGASVRYLDLLPGQRGFTTTTPSKNRLSQSQHTTPQTTATTDALPTGQREDKEPAGATTCRLAHLGDLELSRNIRYSRRCIKPIFPDGKDRERDRERATITYINSAFLTRTTVVDSHNPCSAGIEDLPCHALELAVPPPAPKTDGQYTHLVFGIATSSKRLTDSKATFAHWLADSGATLVCILTDDARDLPSLHFEAVEAEYAASGMKLKLFGKHTSHDSPEQSHMMVIRDVLSHAATAFTEPEWLGIIDDDTFIPSLHALSTELRRHDHTESQYLGALTEDANAIRQGILAAWGGAGIFLSLALAKEMGPHLDDCLDASPAGDMLIMKCVHKYSHARLTMVPGLWQMDFFGDTAGFYESGRRMLSMHHWKSWHWLPAREMAAITQICGDCFLRRFVFTPGTGVATRGRTRDAPPRPTGVDGVAVLNVGYSINLYTGDEVLPDLRRTELTWDGDRAWDAYEWSVGPLRPRVDTTTKKTWWLKTAVLGENGSLIQIYLHKGTPEDTEDEVIELVWQP